MRPWIAALVIGATALPLAACNRQKSNDQQASAVASAPAPVPTPTRKPGLWKQTMFLEDNNAMQTASLCLDKAADAKMAWWAQQGVRGGCAKNDVQRQPDGSWKFSSVCEMAGGIKMVTEGSAVGDFDSKYQVKAETTTTGAPMPQMNGTHAVTIDATWEGPCPEGMQPGDMQLPDGRRVNMLAMANAAPKAP